MKTAKVTSLIVKIVGWVLIALALVLTIYNLANDSASWKEMRSMLKNVDESTGAFERVAFDHQYFKALISAAGTKTQTDEERVEDVRRWFAPWEEQMVEGKAAKDAAEIDAFYAEFNETFDAKAYLEFYENMESSEETRHIKQAIDYLDANVKPASGKGGKLAKLQAASVEDDMVKLYASYTELYGEEAGTYLEFVESIAYLVKQDIDAGKSVSDIKAFTNNLSAEDYASALALIREQEREAVGDIRDGFAEAAQKFAEGDKDAVRAYENELYQSFKEQFADNFGISELVFHNTLFKFYNDESFDGSVNSFMKELRSAQSVENSSSATLIWGSAVQESKVVVTTSSTEVAMKTFSSNVVAISDKSNDIGLAQALWFLAAHFVLLWLIGILLLVMSRVIKRVTEKVTLARLDKAGIEEQDDVLLRVEHLKQYFRSGDFINKAVDDVSFYIKKGEVFGLVGESGCGKTTTGRTIINLYDPTDGDVYFKGQRISSTQNGLSVLIKSYKNEFEAKQIARRAQLKEQVRLHPENQAQLEAEFKKWYADEKAELKKRISKARDKAIETSIEKSKCVERYRISRKAELTKQYEEDIKTLSGEALEERKAAYERDMKVAAKDNVMTKMQMIFQDPIASINPRMTVREIIAEGLKIRGIKDEKYIDQKVYEVLTLVGLVPEHASRYPHEFSGGQRQRIGIARAIVLEPEIIIADEPISALDVSIQAQVINLLNDLRDKMGLTIMFIAHNLSVVKYFSDRIGVMYYGHLVELTTSEELFAHPLHPYTKSLLSAIPYPDPYHEKHRKRIEYDPNRAHDYSVDKPTLREIKPGHFIRCNDAELEAYKKELGI